MQRFRNSASLRLTMLMTAVISAVMLAALVIQYVQMSREFDRRQMVELRSDLGAYSALYEQRRIISLRQAMEFRAASEAGFERIYLLLDKQHEFLGGNITVWPEGVKASDRNFATLPSQVFSYQTPNGITAQFLGVARDLPGGFPLLVARSLAGRDRVLAGMRQMILAVGLGMAVISLLAGWLVSRMVMGRIDRVNALADQVAEGDLHARIPGPQSCDEFGQLEGHVHAMLDRIGALQRATYRLSDAIAHELRTPLNRIRQKLDRIDGDADKIAELEGEMESAIRVFDALLDIASAEAATGSKPGLHPVDLSAICLQVFDLYEPVAEDRGLLFSHQITPDLWVLGDENLVAQLLSNLVDNALKFCAKGDAVSVELAANKARLELLVRDTGPGLPEGLGDNLFERFARGERDMGVAGHGLGLALVQAIATRHGANLRIPETQSGLAVLTQWPRIDPPLGG